MGSQTNKESRRIFTLYLPKSEAQAVIDKAKKFDITYTMVLRLCVREALMQKTEVPEVV